MKLDLTVVPNIEATWDNPYLTSRLTKAGYLAAQLNKFINSPEAIQQPQIRSSLINQLCKTKAINVLLESNTLDSDVFCALVSAYVVEKSQEYSQERLQSFPVPYSVIGKVVKDLIGEENEDTNESESESSG